MGKFINKFKFWLIWPFVWYWRVKFQTAFVLTLTFTLIVGGLILGAYNGNERRYPQEIKSNQPFSFVAVRSDQVTIVTSQSATLFLSSTDDFNFDFQGQHIGAEQVRPQRALWENSEWVYVRELALVAGEYQFQLVAKSPVAFELKTDEPAPKFVAKSNHSDVCTDVTCLEWWRVSLIGGIIGLICSLPHLMPWLLDL